MTAEQIIEAMRAAGITFGTEFADKIRRAWTLDQSQATDKYLAMSAAQKQVVCDAAIKHVHCRFCGANAGRACAIVPPYARSLDRFAHTGRWMEYLIDQDLFEMLGPTRLEFKDATGPAASLIDPLDDLLGP